MKKYLDTHTAAQVLLALKDNPAGKHKLLKMYNEEVCKLILAGKTLHHPSDDFANANTMIDKVKQIHKIDVSVTPDLRSALFNNCASYYEK